MEHRACIKQLGIESESATLARQSAPVVDAARMMKEQRRFSVPHQLHYFASELAVGNSDPLKIDIHACLLPNDLALHEPVPEALASYWTRQGVLRPRHHLCQ